MTDVERSRDSGGDREHNFGRHETTEERADRQWTEMLQEVRVAQTGAQILFGFLLRIVFTPRFEQLSPFDKNLYVVTVVLGALATDALVAPVSFHRTLAGHRRKPQLIQVTGRLIVTGLTLALCFSCSGSRWKPASLGLSRGSYSSDSRAVG
ncbi:MULTISPECIES: DUF6328 family protein [unclassified Streptomyces]|uniref:DUF6328 family protein n=1 Tax=unclassified Streptomyces TaxID=2593676 RepID=UPI002E80561B|nr:DUF6328 family protein [Streptomyces sp. NBC_00562]